MPYLLARGAAEAHLYMLLHPCEECGEVEFEPDAAPGADGADLVVRYAGDCPACGVRREFAFRMLGTDPGGTGDGLAFGGDRVSKLIDPGEWVWFADRLAATVPADWTGLSDAERAAAVEDLGTAAAAVDEAVKFIPDGQDLVPFSAFVSDRGRAVYAEEPGRFRRVRLDGARAEYRRLAAELGGTGGVTARAAAEAALSADPATASEDPPFAEFATARVFDATLPDGTAVMAPDHERIADPDERERLLTYLREAPVAVMTLSEDEDRFQPERGRVVPMSIRTDGTWLWSDALAYYLELYGFAPEPALRQHIADNGYRVPEVSEDVLLIAGQAVEDQGR